MEALFLMSFWNHQWYVCLTRLNKWCSCTEVQFFLLGVNPMWPKAPSGSVNGAQWMVKLRSGHHSGLEKQVPDHLEYMISTLGPLVKVYQGQVLILGLSWISPAVYIPRPAFLLTRSPLLTSICSSLRAPETSSTSLQHSFILWDSSWDWRVNASDGLGTVSPRVTSREYGRRGACMADSDLGRHSWAPQNCTFFLSSLISSPYSPSGTHYGFHPWCSWLLISDFKQ